MTEEQTTHQDVSALLEILVPPDTVQITDIFGNKHDMSSVVGARTQIKIARKLEFIKDIEVDDNLDMTTNAGMIQSVIKIAQNEQVLDILATCFEIAHPKTATVIKEHADGEDFEYIDILDLLPIEEVVTAIVPLFIRALRKGMLAVQSLGLNQTL